MTQINKLQGLNSTRQVSNNTQTKGYAYLLNQPIADKIELSSSAKKQKITL